MGKNKNGFNKNRIKGFLGRSAKYGKNRIKEDAESSSIQEMDDKWKEDDQNLNDPQEGDRS